MSNYMKYITSIQFGNDVVREMECAVVVIAYDTLDRASRRGLPYTSARTYKEGVLAGSTVGGREMAFAYVFPTEEDAFVNDGFAHLLPAVQAFLKEDMPCPTK